VDTYFRVPTGRLKLRETRLTGSELVGYIRPDRRGPKRSQYVEIPVKNPSAVRAMLSRLLGVRVVVKKTRDIYLLGSVRIHLDKVDGLGAFIEFEAYYDGSPSAERANRDKVVRLMDAFGISAKDLMEVSYADMLAGKRGTQNVKRDA
jgi:predicted adenylyl cyclase CyaB